MNDCLSKPVDRSRMEEALLRLIPSAGRAADPAAILSEPRIGQLAHKHPHRNRRLAWGGMDRFTRENVLLARVLRCNGGMSLRRLLLALLLVGPAVILTMARLCRLQEQRFDGSMPNEAARS